MFWVLVSYWPWRLLLKLENEHAPKTVKWNSQVLPSKNTCAALVVSWTVQKGCLFHQLGLITLMWEASESLLSLSDCSPPESFPYLSPDDDTAQHHTGSIIREIFSHMCPLMMHYSENDSLVVLFSCEMIPQCANIKQKKEDLRVRFERLFLSFNYPADVTYGCLFLVFLSLLLWSRLASCWSRLLWQQQEHRRLVLSLLFMV